MTRLSLLAASGLLWTLPAAAQERAQPPRGQRRMQHGQEMDHSRMQGMGHSRMQGMDHSRMQGRAPHDQPRDRNASPQRQPRQAQPQRN